MKSTSWRSFAAATMGLIAGANAQTGSLTDLGTLLAGQKNLTTFYGLIEVSFGSLHMSKLGDSLTDSLV